MYTPSASLSAVLEDLRRRFAPGYGDGLTNHMPMACIALDRLGADDERKRATVDAHAPALEAARPWPAAEGIALEMRDRGVDAVLHERLQRHLGGLAGAAFHGVIRLAYATMSRDLDEIAHGLAYLEESSLVFDVTMTTATTTTTTATAATGASNELSDLADALRAAKLAKPTGPNITLRMEQVARDARFVEVASRLVVDKSTLRQVSGIGARWYLAADDFASLHVLTGAHAVRLLRPWTTDTRAADRALAVAALACFVVSGCPARADARSRDRAEDKELKYAAVHNANDDHMAKLIVAALDEEEAHEDAIYRIVATRAARRGHT